ERLREALGVGVTVVDGGGRVDALVGEDELRGGATLEEVVVRGAVVAGLVVGARGAREVRGQRRRGVRRADHDHASVGEDRHGCD
ncbi:hypothetical protein DF186_20130, partial [Enterococcus hirae]